MTDMVKARHGHTEDINARFVKQNSPSGKNMMTLPLLKLDFDNNCITTFKYL